MLVGSMTSPWLNKNTMTKWLKIPVKEIRIEGDNEKGGNYLSTLKKIVAVSIEGETIPLIVKLPNVSGSTTADVFKDTNVFAKEEEMYRNTIARLYDILCEAYPGEYEPFAPQYYHISKDFLVMEDLTARGFRMPDKMIGLDLDQSLLVMRTLAKFHAASVILLQRNPQAFDKFNVLLYQEPDLYGPYGKHISGLTMTLAEELETWGKEWHKYVGKLRYLATDILSRAGEVATKRDSDFNVLNHGDLWVHNMMFKDGSAGIRLLDFQTVYFGSPAIDLNYFVATSPAFEVRENHMEQIIEEYHRTLCNTLTALKYQEKLITLEELQQEIDKKALFGLFSLIGPCALMQSDSEKHFSFDESLAMGKNPGPSMYSKIYKKNVKLMLPLYDSKGAFAFDV